MDAFVSDIRYGLRLLAKAPGFTTIAIATLALGIGANTAIFSTVDALLIRALPYESPDRVVIVWEDARHAGFPRNTPAPANYADWARLNQSFTAMAATRGATANVTGDGLAEQILGRAVTANFFTVLGVKPIVGRTFTEEEDRTGAPVTVISSGLWQRRYGGDPSIVGRTLLLNDNRSEVIGVMPRDFVFRNREIDYWVPMHFTPAQIATRGSHYLNVVARLSPGVTVDAARADMDRIAAMLRTEHPDSNANIGAVVVPIKEELLGDTRLALLVLMAAAGAVLLIACANLASLLLARAIDRRGELAVRAALGATRGRLVRQMVVEATLFALAGGALALAIAPAGIGVIAQLTPSGFPAQPSSVLDLRLLAFTTIVSLTTALAFSAVPALHAARAPVADSLHDAARSTVGGRARFTRDVLVVLQVAAALVLLVAAGLMLRTLANLRAIDLGFNPAGLLTMRTTLPATRYADATKRLAFYDRVTAGAGTLPGVEAAAYGSTLPFLSIGNTTYFAIEGRTLNDPSDPPDALLRVGTPGYLATLGVHAIEGRLLDDRDGANAPRTAVVNETLARKYWPRESALGHRMRFGDPQAPLHTIVGVVRDIRERGYARPLKPGVYLSFAQAPATWAIPEYLVVRVKRNPADFAEPLRRIVTAADADQPVSAVRTMDDIIDRDVADRQQQMTLLGAFAALALLLAATGLYGVLSYAVTQRARELGLRIALGASTGSVVRMVVARGIALTAIGLSVGGAVAWASARILEGLLYGVTAGDPVTFASVGALLGAIGVAASYLPARRASRIDPVVVLRES